MSIIICTIVTLVLLITGAGLFYLNWQHPYLEPTTAPKKRSAKFKLFQQARQTVTAAQPGLKRLFLMSQISLWLGLILWLVSFYLLETKLDLLVFPTQLSWTSAILVVLGAALLMVYPLVWTSQSYQYWAKQSTAKQAFVLASGEAFKHYRRRQIWGTLAIAAAGLVLWATRILAVGTEPTISIQDLVMALVAAIPVIALVVGLVQLAYLHQYRYLLVDKHEIRFGQRHYQATKALVKHQPALKTKVITWHTLRIIGYLMGLIAIWILYRNIIAPAFSVDLTAVFPGAIMALIALCLVEIVGFCWPQRNYDYLHSLKTTNLPFTIAEPDTFDRFRYHLRTFHVAAGIIWVSIWLVILGSYYYITLMAAYSSYSY
ncbi:hypothetical protein RA086_06815 [Lactiplantibacillus sp. WILCCON 0030]|uniref:Integral membrane protein n=1 Tax=Lactiplantibacillus brownii TaxID=3069269 RepID=A0ABU1A8P5_9LACO|nr:hypothetical protein [Lactiplantibacillus brownii]MDQ7937337.1 hypothetical protein [Lactiplantibacillus brownii]